jgi:hypothetical protein
VMLIWPQLYPGYLMLEEKQNLKTLKIGVSGAWILFSICILVLILVYVLFCRSIRSKKKNGMDR